MSFDDYSSSKQSWYISPSVLQAAQLGDEQAFKAIVDAFGDLVRYWCRRSQLTKEDIDDVFQNVFLTVFSKLPEFNQSTDDTLRGWIRIITRSKIVDRIRENNAWKQKVVSRGPTQGSSDPAGESAPLVTSIICFIRANFSERDCRLFQRVLFDGTEPKEVALEMGITANTVYIAMSRILKLLRETFEPSLPFQPLRVPFDWRLVLAADLRNWSGAPFTAGDEREWRRTFDFPRTPTSPQSSYRLVTPEEERLFHLGWEPDPIQVLADCLARGANINAQDHVGNTALTIALNYRKRHLIQPLLNAGADPNFPNGRPIIAACKKVRKRDDLEIVRLLIECGACVQPCVPHVMNLSSPQLACELIALIMAEKPNLEERHDGVVTGLLSANIQGKDLMHWIEWGADVNARGPDGQTALMWSGSAGNSRILINAGADINAVDDEGRSALIYAIHREIPSDAIQLLLEAGADVTLRDSSGRRALDYAVENAVAAKLRLHLTQSTIVSICGENSEDHIVSQVASDSASELEEAERVRRLLAGPQATESVRQKFVKWLRRLWVNR